MKFVQYNNNSKEIKSLLERIDNKVDNNYQALNEMKEILVLR